MGRVISLGIFTLLNSSFSKLTFVCYMEEDPSFSDESFDLSEISQWYGLVFLHDGTKLTDTSLVKIKRFYQSHRSFDADLSKLKRSRTVRLLFGGSFVDVPENRVQP